MPIATSAVSIQEITTRTKSTQHKKVRDQIDTIESLGTKLKYSVKDRDQTYSLPSFFFIKKLTLYDMHLSYNFCYFIFIINFFIKR